MKIDNDIPIPKECINKSRTKYSFLTILEVGESVKIHDTYDSVNRTKAYNAIKQQQYNLKKEKLKDKEFFVGNHENTVRVWRVK